MSDVVVIPMAMSHFSLVSIEKTLKTISDVQKWAKFPKKIKILPNFVNVRRESDKAFMSEIKNKQSNLLIYDEFELVFLRNCASISNFINLGFTLKKRESDTIQLINKEILR